MALINFSGPGKLAGLLIICLTVAGNSGAVNAGQGKDLGYGLTVTYGQPAAPQLALKGLDDRDYSLAALEGTVVIVNFWATWCPPCVDELPKLAELKRLMQGRDFQILAVNLNEKPEDVRRFLKDFGHRLDFPILLDPGPELLTEWKLKALPTSYIIDRQNRLIYRAMGPRDFSHPHIVDRIQALFDG